MAKTEQEAASSEQKSRGRGRPRVPGPIEDKIKEYALMGWTPPQIHQQLAVDFPNIKPLPVLKTVRLIAKPYRPSKYWSLAEADPDDAALLLPVLAEAAAAGSRFTMVPAEGEPYSKVAIPVPLPVPLELAESIVRVCRAAPGIPWLWAVHVAADYIWRLRDGLPTAGMDLLLGFRPWESVRHRRRYLETIAKIRPDYFKRGSSFDRLLRARGNTVRLYSDDPVKDVIEVQIPLYREITKDPIACGLNIVGAKIDWVVFLKGEPDAKG